MAPLKLAVGCRQNFGCTAVMDPSSLLLEISRLANTGALSTAGHLHRAIHYLFVSDHLLFPHPTVLLSYAQAVLQDCLEGGGKRVRVSPGRVAAPAVLRVYFCPGPCALRVCACARTLQWLCQLPLILARLAQSTRLRREPLARRVPRKLERQSDHLRDSKPKTKSDRISHFLPSAASRAPSILCHDQVNRADFSSLERPADRFPPNSRQKPAISTPVIFASAR
jgi:hypothetical protein